jgi:hypothetical protein
MTRSYHYVYHPGRWYEKFLEKAHPNAIRQTIQTDKTYFFPKRSCRFNRRGKILVSHCPLVGQSSECEKVVIKKYEPKPGDERKTNKRRNRYTMIEKYDVYE